MAYVVGLGCCMTERRAQPASRSWCPLEQIKTNDINWSTSTLGIETERTFRTEAVRSDPPRPPDIRDIPLSSIEFYAPSTAPTPPPPVARPQSRSRPWREKRRGRIDSSSPVVTITDHDIATGTGTTPSTGECQRERKECRFRRQHRDNERETETVGTVQAWSQVDPLYGMYQREHRVQRDRQAQTGGRGRYVDIRAFDFMSYGGWIVI
ncbi:hypothetical protein A1O7_00081 [Cladophialophora yegresii CBS 114405]|uniref:Uncharacterized protein n=1 Tax=Cladophialophora yegresii CBS 114405 TaxID=1182544 RepID=W9WGN9_9EURO|nr:uncharacterized protein A1O7_00081 [Cladophialophora yegresii CBS 114405]EXJ63746.1 hypothetical protein A1O7_00081 [Cladophialophora yegresii CBS 114405]